MLTNPIALTPEQVHSLLNRGLIKPPPPEPLKINRVYHSRYTPAERLERRRKARRDFRDRQRQKKGLEAS